MNGTVALQSMVRLSYSFPDVDDKTRKRIYDVIYRNDLRENQFGGGYGDGSNNSGTLYLPEADARNMAAELEKLGLTIQG